MKLISKDAAIAAISFSPDEVKPLSGYYVPALLAAIAERYQLAVSPSVKEATEVGAKFKQGRLVKDDRAIAITDLGVFNDALSATTTDTADSEAVIHDLFAWLKQTFHYRDPVTKPNYLFQSDLIVEFANDPADKFGSLAPLFEFLQEVMGTTMGVKNPVQFSRIAFGAEPGPVPEFVIERRAGAAWSSKRYFCKAHMPTDAHIRALELLDGILAS